jgi:uncharacterized RDD family membrane protein YckC
VQTSDDSTVPVPNSSAGTDTTALADLGRARLPARLVARAIDVCIIGGVDVGLGQIIGFGFGWLALGTALVLAYFAGLDTLFGATVGKRLMGLRVIGPDGRTPTLKQAAIREAFTVVGSVPFVGVFLALAAWIWIALSIRSNPLGQGKHDLLAGGTRVIVVTKARE